MHVGHQTAREVYKYRLLPQSSVGPNTAWLCHTAESSLNLRNHQMLFCSEPIISSSTLDFSELFSILTRTVYTTMIQVSQPLLGDRCIDFLSTHAN